MIITRKILGLYRNILILLGANPLDATYSKRFFKGCFKADKSSRLLADYMASNYKIENVIDLGCGIGIYLQKFSKKGINILGIDGSKNAKKKSVINPKYIFINDLTKPIHFKKKFDLVLCIEVAEHVQKSKADILVKNICNCGDFLLFTAAPPGQGGTDHLNEQPKEYWINKFEREGFYYMGDETIKLKKYLSKNNAIKWLVKNLMIFKKRGLMKNDKI